MQSPQRAGFVFEFGFEELCGQVVGGVVYPPVDEFGECLADGHDAAAIIHLPATFDGELSVAVLFDDGSESALGCRTACRPRAAASQSRDP